MALTEAISYGRPRATRLRDQIRRLLGETYVVSFHELATDPRYVLEVLPVLAAEQVRQRRDDGSLTRRLGDRPGVFHLSVAERDEERYAFTVRGTAVSRRGAVPVALDPDRLFPQDEPHEERLGERRALEALVAEFGVGLPRLALERGRLHTFRTRSWRRPLSPGDRFVTVDVVWQQP
ncbi:MULTISPECIES: hypothetical protein [Streptomyces]|uniref:hypothetical protein n=1 Tax=Streptomyces TaxID=1883 RepID=UPI0002E692B6|nr:MULTISPECIES: hypothetical protein [Streptomyces]